MTSFAAVALYFSEIQAIRGGISSIGYFFRTYAQKLYVWTRFGVSWPSPSLHPFQSLIFRY